MEATLQHPLPRNEAQSAIQVSSSSLPVLPPELITEILSRLPVKPLLKFRSVSKSWLALISSGRFINTHLHLSANSNCHRVMLNFCPGSNLKDCTLSSIFNESATEALNLDYRITSDGLCKELPDYLLIVGSVNGLICLFIERDWFIWNPAIRKYKKLPHPATPSRFCFWEIYGFGYDEFHDDYKVVGTFATPDRVEQAQLKICSLKSDSWRTIDGCGNWLRLKASGKFVKGKLHWPTLENGERWSWNVISLDLGNEKWGKMELPSSGEGDNATLSLGVLRGDISVFYDFPRTHVDVWVMKEYGVKESWTNMFKVAYPDHEHWSGHLFSLPSFMSNDGEIFLVFNSTSMIYDPKNESLRSSELINYEGEREVQAEIYVESLVCPLSIEDAIEKWKLCEEEQLINATAD